jgi:hypothetical protein
MLPCAAQEGKLGEKHRRAAKRYYLERHKGNVPRVQQLQKMDHTVGDGLLFYWGGTAMFPLDHRFRCNQWGWSQGLAFEGRDDLISMIHALHQSLGVS